MLVPTGEWTLTGLNSIVDSWSIPDTRREFWAATRADGPFGPVVVGRFDRGPETRDHADGPRNYEEKKTPGGITVRIGYDNRPRSLSGIFLVEGGSVSASAFDVSEDDFLAVIDEMQVDEDGIGPAPDAKLPAGLEILESLDASPFFRTTLATNRSLAEQLEVQVLDRAAWWEVLNVRRFSIEPEPITVDGNRGLLFAGDRNNWPGALLQTSDRIYVFSAPLFPQSAEPLPADEIMTILTSLEVRSSSDLSAGLGLTARADVYGGWFAETPLPPQPRAWMEG